MESIWAKVGSWGVYQKVILCSMPFAVLAAAGNFLLSSFLILEPKWDCCPYSSTDPLSVSPKTIPNCHPTSPTLNFGQNCSLLETCPEDQLVFKSDFHSIAEQWKLLCGEQSYLVHSTVSLQNMPMLVGLLLWGPLSDRFGRKPVTIISTAAMFLSSFLSACAPDIRVFLFLRMCFGFVFAGGANIFQAWAMEMTDQSYGFLINSLTHWHYAYCLVAIIAYITADWRTYILVLNCLCLPVIFFYSFYYLESPRWLIQKGRLDQAASVLRQISVINGREKIKVTSKDLLNADPGDHEHANHSKADSISAVPNSNTHFLALFATKQRAIHSTCLGFTFLTASIASGTIILDIGNLWGNIFMNFFLLGLFRCFTPLISVCLDWRYPDFGRRRFFIFAECSVLFWFLMVIVSRTILMAWWPVLGNPIVTLSSLAGAITNMLVWIVIVQLGFELYPTLLRSTAFSYVFFMDALGAVLVPQIVYLKKFYHTAPAYVVSFMIIVTVASGYLIYPETKAPERPNDHKHRPEGMVSMEQEALLQEEEDEYDNHE